MAAYDLDEQEKLGDLKAWWNRNGNIVTGIVVVLALAVAGSQGWKWWNKKQATEASTLYFAISEGITKNETAKVKDATAQLLEKFGSTGYAPRGALLAAKAAFDANDLDTARKHLEWVVANSKEDELKYVARLRLASVLMDKKEFDAALAALDGKHHESFAGLFLDARGDVFKLQGKFADAKTAYEEALKKLDAKGAQRQLTQLKLDSLPISVATIAAPAAAQTAPAPTPGSPATASDAKTTAPTDATKAAAPAVDAKASEAKKP
jgi:predicted negative regulator of RcsB-dependent stress response